ncbi:MAG: hypothetical protein JSR18_05395 [Proteobacteria bacterium]|nr:hypothetical protein [Pseudomonadota bacterium]
MIRIRTLAFGACCIASLATPAFAADAAPAASAAAATKNPCDKPDPFPGKLASDRQKTTWQKSLDAYGVCIKKFSDEQRAIAESAIKAGNDAVAEYNAVVQNAKDEIAKDQ